MLNHLATVTTFIFVCYPLCAIANSLDAPATKLITVRSEIKRGVDLSFSCMINNKPGDWNNFSKCVDDSMDKNQQSNTDSQAFKLGVYWRAIQSLEIVRSVAHQYQHVDLRSNNEFRLVENVYFKQYRDIEIQLEVSDKDICVAIGSPHPEVCKTLTIDP